MKMSFPIKLDARETLHPEQHYALDIADAKGYSYAVLGHRKDTISCEAKLELLSESPKYRSWSLEQIWKAVYLGRGDHPLIGIIAPGTVRNVPQGKVLKKEILGEDLSQKGRYWADPMKIPFWMAWGTCTPIPLISTVGKGKEISHLVFYDSLRTMDQPVDISIGGTNKESYQISVHILGSAIPEILTEQFGPKIVHSFNPAI